MIQIGVFFIGIAKNYKEIVKNFIETGNSYKVFADLYQENADFHKQNNKNLMQIIPHHIGLTVPDLAKAVQWYTSVLGFDVATELTVPETGLQIAMLHKDGFRLELFGHPQSSRLEPMYSDIPLHLSREGWRHLAFTVDNLQETFDDVLAKGAVSAGGPTHNPTLGFSYAFVADPFGNLVEFVQVD